jgi:hypothetical protein
VTAADRLDSAFDVETGKQHVQAIAEEIYRRLGEEGLEQIGRLKRISMWQQAAKVKDADGVEEIEVTDLHGFQLAPSWDQDPEWPTIQPAAPVKITATKPKPREVDYRTTVVLPDPQIGYRRMENGLLVPMQDERALDLAIQIIAHVKPQRVVNLGDTLDLSEWTSKFIVLPEFVLTTQPALDRAQRFLAEQRANMGPTDEDRPVKKLRGNHDDRLQMAITKNTMAAIRLRQANKPDSWPVLSWEHLLDVDSIGVEISAGYPAGRFKLADGNGRKTPLYAQHGKILDIVKVAKTSRHSVIQGHTHHIAEHHMTYDVDGLPQHVVAIASGCLARTDGAVPSTHSGEFANGMPAKIVEDWQQCVILVHEWPDGFWSHDIVHIHDGRAVLGDREFVATVDLMGDPV